MRDISFQFQVSLCDMNGDPHDQCFGGVEFDNSWKAALSFAKRWLEREKKKWPDQTYKCIVYDLMNRKPTTEITL